jgi:hypothetical protein
MARFSLVPYTIRVKEKRTKTYLPLGDIDRLDLIDIIDSYLRTISNSASDLDDTSVIQAGKYNLGNRVLNGIIKGGHAGYTADLIDTQTDALSYQRKISDAELIPYYFLMKLPINADKGIVIFQKFDQSGIKEIFFEGFHGYFKMKLGDDYTLELYPLVPKDLIREYLKGRIVKVRLIKQRFPRDISDVRFDAIAEDDDFSSELIYSAKRNASLPKRILDKIFPNGIDKFLESDDKPVGSMVEVENFEFNKIKLKVRVGKSYRTIDMSDTDKLRYSQDISDEVEKDSDGHPKLNSIDSLAKEFLGNLADSVWGEVGNV